VDVLARIDEQATRMLAMIEQLLDLQRIEGGMLLLELSRFDLGELVRHITEELQMTTSRHQLTADIAGTVPVVADRRRLEEVLHNCLDNAIKYSPQGGPIAVRVFFSTSSNELPAMTAVVGESDTARYAVVEVTDRGIGIADRDQPRIFERFYQAAGTPYKGRVGLGLGLYISKEIIARHGGRMWVESESAAGSRFYFSVPLAAHASRDQEKKNRG
jgi:signal transduction histidine kinase